MVPTVYSVIFFTKKLLDPQYSGTGIMLKPFLCLKELVCFKMRFLVEK